MSRLLIVFRLLSLTVLVAVLACPKSSGSDLSGTARVDTLTWRCTVDGNSATINLHRRVTVLNAAGKDFGQIYVREDSYHKINSVEARICGADGHLIKKIGKKEMTKFCGYGGAYDLYDDNCSYAYEPASAAYPYTVTLDCEIELKSLFFLTGIDFFTDIPTTFGQVELSYDTANPVRYKAYRVKFDTTERTEKARRIITWTVRDLGALEDLHYASSEYWEGPRIRFGSERFQLGDYSLNSRTWKSFGLFDKSLCDSRYLPSPSSVPSPGSPEEAVLTANRLYNELTQKTRYVAVSMGLSGWQPEFATKTERTSYGDCKGLSTLLISRLRNAGIKACPVLVLTNDEGAVDSSFVYNYFNHFITMAFVGSDTLWFDPTSHYCPAGSIREDDENTLALAITDTGGVIVRTPHGPG